MKWNFFLKEELISTIEKCNNSLTPRLDILSWRYFKRIVKNIICLNKFINITNTCIDIGHWLLHFKVLTTIIIFKHNKESYDFLKPIDLLFCLTQLANYLRRLLAKDYSFCQFLITLFICAN